MSKTTTATITAQSKPNENRLTTDRQELIDKNAANGYKAIFMLKIFLEKLSYLWLRVLLKISY